MHNFLWMPPDDGEDNLQDQSNVAYSTTTTRRRTQHPHVQDYTDAVLADFAD